MAKTPKIGALGRVPRSTSPKVGDTVVFKFGWIGNVMRESIDNKRELLAKVTGVRKDGSLDLFVDVPEQHAPNGWNLEGIMREGEAAIMVDQIYPPDCWAWA